MCSSLLHVKVLGDSEEPDTEQQVPRKGGGGAWRAFLHCRAKGRQLNTKMIRGLRDEYRDLTAEQKKHYTQLGKRGALLHSRGEQAFPSQSRVETEAQVCNEASAECLDMAWAGKLPHNDVLAKLQSTRSARGLTALTRNLARSLRNTKKEIVKGVSNLPAVITYMYGAEADNAFATRQFLLTLQTGGWQLQPYSPRSITLALSFEPEHVVGHASIAATTDSTKALATAWEDRHRGVQQSTWQFPEPKKRQRKCFVAGFCYCSGRGHKVGSLKTKLMAMVNVAAEGKTLETKLLNGYIIFQFAAVDVEPAHRPPSKRRRNADPNEGCDHIESESMFVHVSLQYVRPWRGTWTLLQTEMTREERIAAVEKVDADDRALARCFSFSCHMLRDGRPDIRSMWHFLSELDLRQPWSVKMWEIVERQRPVASVNNVVYARPTHVPVRKIWDPSGKMPAPRAVDRLEVDPGDEVLAPPPDDVLDGAPALEEEDADVAEAEQGPFLDAGDLGDEALEGNTSDDASENEAFVLDEATKAYYETWLNDLAADESERGRTSSSSSSTSSSSSSDADESANPSFLVERFGWTCRNLLSKS
eukprot:4091426-Amphidinium_carterae.1